MKQNSEREECAHVSVFEPRPNRSMELETHNEYSWPLFCGQYLLGHRFYLAGVAEDPYTLLTPALFYHGCKNHFIKQEWANLATSGWEDCTWMTSGKNALKEVWQDIVVARQIPEANLHNHSQGREHQYQKLNDLPVIVQGVFDDEMNKRRFQNPFECKRDLAQLGDALLMLLLQAAIEHTRHKWRSLIPKEIDVAFQGACQSRAGARGTQADLFNAWEIQEMRSENHFTTTNEEKLNHKKSTIFEILVAELWLLVHDRSKRIDERQSFRAVLGLIVYSLLFRRLQIDFCFKDGTKNLMRSQISFLGC